MACLKEIEGDLLELKNIDCIVQQINCVTVTAHGLSASIAKKYPYADVYSSRTPYKKGLNRAALESRPKMGSVILKRPPASSSNLLSNFIKERKEENKIVSQPPVVACLVAQITPSKPGYYNQVYNISIEEDNKEARAQAFQQCLTNLAELMKKEENKTWKTIAFPYQIGCGLAGGNWKDYYSYIQEFVKVLDQEITVFIVKLKS